MERGSARGGEITRTHRDSLCPLVHRVNVVGEITYFHLDAMKSTMFWHRTVIVPQESSSLEVEREYQFPEVQHEGSLDDDTFHEVEDW